jgi:membrane-associated protein
MPDFKGWIVLLGYPGMAAAIFAETGLLVGFFLPGDTLLLTAGFLAERGAISIWVLWPLLSVAAIAGDTTGYWIGRRAGPGLFQREDGRFFKKSRLRRAQRFFDKHGGKTILLARFIGYVRTFAPTVAGAAGMSYLPFVIYNVVGGIAWVISLLLVGYFLGGRIDNLDAYVAVLAGGAVLLTVLAFGFRWLRNRRKAANAPGRERVAPVADGKTPDSPSGGGDTPQNRQRR